MEGSRSTGKVVASEATTMRKACGSVVSLSKQGSALPQDRRRPTPPISNSAVHRNRNHLPHLPRITDVVDFVAFGESQVKLPHHLLPHSTYRCKTKSEADEEREASAGHLDPLDCTGEEKLWFMLTTHQKRRKEEEMMCITPCACLGYKKRGKRRRRSRKRERSKCWKRWFESEPRD